MANKTFIPAFRARVGDWDYYICTMKYAEVARQVAFAYELGGNRDLSTMIQRGISGRTEEITNYLLTSEHRFLGALIVAAWGGAPEYQSIQMDDPEGLLNGIDRGFGVLSFDGTQQYFALDGQHRLKAIKDAIKKNPEIGREDICVLLVSHYETETGRERTRRLFTNINRNAKATKAAENIALDEDFGVNILTRRLLEEHDFLSKEGIVLVFTKQGDEGEISLAGNAISRTHPKAWTTITVLNDLISILSFGLPESIARTDIRPTDTDLEDAYQIITRRLDDLLEYCGEIRTKLINTPNARDIRAPKDREYEGHAFMRPVVQKSIARALQQLMTQKSLDWNEAMKRLSELDWELHKAPWTAVYAVEANKMLTTKEFSELLDDLLICHICPPSRQFVKNSRKKYKELLSKDYPVKEETLCKYLAGSDPD